MYEDVYSEEIIKKLKKLKKKDPSHYWIVRRKMDHVIRYPDHSYKFLRHDMKGIKRIHLGHFVLIFVIDHKNRIISFEDYDHHDNIYKQ